VFAYYPVIYTHLCSAESTEKRLTRKHAQHDFSLSTLQIVCQRLLVHEVLAHAPKHGRRAGHRYTARENAFPSWKNSRKCVETVSVTVCAMNTYFFPKHSRNTERERGGGGGRRKLQKKKPEKIHGIYIKFYRG
jgi:hypothetical protein